MRAYMQQLQPRPGLAEEGGILRDLKAVGSGKRQLKQKLVKRKVFMHYVLDVCCVRGSIACFMLTRNFV